MLWGCGRRKALLFFLMQLSPVLGWWAGAGRGAPPFPHTIPSGPQADPTLHDYNGIVCDCKICF